MINPLKRLESMNAFTANEAWKIFRITAFAEAFGWSILIIGIAINHYRLPGKNLSIPIAGQIHGSIFIAYFVITLFLYPSLNWSRTKTLLAFLSGIPPYGSIIFELIAARQQLKEKELNTFVGLIYLSKGSLLVMQPSRGVNWILPQIPLKNSETPTQGLVRLMNTFFGEILPYHPQPYKRGNTLYFRINTEVDITKALESAQRSKSPYADEFTLFRKSEAKKLLDGISIN